MRKIGKQATKNNPMRLKDREKIIVPFKYKKCTLFAFFLSFLEFYNNTDLFESWSDRHVCLLCRLWIAPPAHHDHLMCLTLCVGLLLCNCQ